jgi:hypothetical protein
MFRKVVVPPSSGTAVHYDFLILKIGGTTVPEEDGAELIYLDLRGRK